MITTTLVAVMVAVVVAGAQVAGSDVARAQGRPAAAPGPVSNAFAMGGGIGGQIDQRTGAFQASIPLLNISGRAGSDLSMSLSYDQNLAVQGAAGNRFGFGAGWALGLPWVDTVGTVRVYAASGGSFQYDAGSSTGLHDYPLQDLMFAKSSGTLPARAGVPQARSYTYTLTYYDGTTDYFDSSGNLLEQSDRFGNLIDLTWRQAGQAGQIWQPVTAVDNYGDVTTFDFSTASQVKVTAPANAEGIAASTTLTVQGGLLRTVTDASGALTSFYYQAVGGLSSQLLHLTVAPSGARTTVDYTTLTYEPAVVVVADVRVTDGSGTAVQTTRTFNADPAGNVAHHNYTGYPAYDKTGTDGLFDSNDKSYRYSTTLSDGRSSVTETYNSLHLLTTRAIRVTDPVRGSVVQQTQTYTYPTVVMVQDLPANYAKPTGVTVVYGDPVYGATRTVKSSSSYDDRGELLSSTDENGTVTSTTYDPRYGVPVTETTTGSDGTTSVTTNTLTSDGSAVRTTSTAVGSSTQKPTARTVTSYSYDTSGEVTGQSVTWAPGAQPAGPSSGPNEIDTTRSIVVDAAARTRTVVDTQAAGTSDAAATTTVTDLITGNVLSTTDPDQLTTSFKYDALGRVTSRTAPGNRTTSTSYPTPLVTDVTDPTGHTTQTTTDVLGRTVKVTDNVSGEALVADPTARTLTVDTYSVDGSKATSTPTTGATTTTSYDPLQRPLKIVKPDGLTETIAYDDVAHTKTTSIIPIGSQTASAVTVDRFDNLARTTASSTSYADDSPQTPSTQSYDGLGRVSSATSNDVTATPRFTGAGGLQNSVALTPTNTDAFPGGTEVARTDNTLTGALSTKTLTDNAGTGTTSTEGATFTYDAAGRVATATDPGGATTSYTYTPGGRTKTVTAPSGTVTTYTYSPTTGELVEKDLTGAHGTTQKTAYTYYADSGLQRSVYDPDHPSDVVEYQYDADAHTTEVRYPDGTSTSAQYADNGELSTATDVTGALTTYHYNGSGMITGATQTRGGVQIADVDYGAYDPLDRVQTIKRGNGVTTTITYSDANQITKETTTGAGGATLRSDSYTYDAHGNSTAHTITTGTTSTTTRYGYDAYDRLVSSAVYPNATGDGTPTSTVDYVLNAGGDVTRQTTTAHGATSTTVNTIAPGDRLTTQTVDGTATDQTYNPDGAVSEDLNGNSYKYNLADQPTSVTTSDGGTTNYTYWPDGSRRSASTTADGVTHTTTLHYDTIGRPTNDTYTDSTGAPSQTASYLFAINRESRSLTSGSGLGHAPGCGKCHRHKPPCHAKKRCSPGPKGSDAPGTQYYLADAHGSMVAMTNSAGAATASYGYSDYGQPTGADSASSATPAATVADNAAVNPFTYNGVYTDASTGTQILPARTYDPAQGRFLSLDGSDMLNRYQAFDTNPINNTDPTGHVAVPDIVSDSMSALLFLAFSILSFIPVVDVLAGATAIADLSTVAVVSFVTNAATAATNLGAFATSTTLTADDGYSLTHGDKGFLTDKERANLETSNFALGTAAGFAGGASGAVGIKAGYEVEAELESTQSSLTSTKTDLATANANLQTTEGRLTDAGTDLQTAQGQLRTADTNLQNTQRQLTDTQRQLTDADTNLQNTQRQLTAANTNLETTQGQLTAAETERDAARTALADTRSELATTQNTLSQTATQVIALTAKLAAAGNSAERAMAQPDPNAHLNAAPTTAAQGANTPIDAARTSNFALIRGWLRSDLGMQPW